MAKKATATNPRTTISVKMTPTLKQRLDRYCTGFIPKLKIQDVVAEAVVQYLESKKRGA
jgi:hypothetical protein